MKKLYPLLALFLTIQLVSAQSDSAAVLMLFDEEVALEMTLEFDMELVLNNRTEKPPYQRVDMTYVDNLGHTHTDNAKIRVRGNSRRGEANCEFPPLRLNVSKKRTKGTPFEGQDKLKIVTHCNDDLYLIREYLTYRMWAELSDYAFKVRLARITYKDTKEVMKPITQYAFFLEDEFMMGKRLEGNLIPPEGGERILPDQADEYEVTRLYIFEYLIGNLDWDVYIKKNVRLVDLDDNPFPVPVPYDFDRSEMVDAPYADGLFDDVKRRAWRELCHTQEIFPDVLDEFKQKKAAIYALYENFPGIKKKEVSRATEYLDVFFDEIADEEAVKRIFMDPCE